MRIPQLILPRVPYLRGLFLAATLSLPILVGACRTPAGDPTAEESAVREGLNDSFLSADLDVGSYVERFEGESREVFAARAELVSALGLTPGMAVADVGAGTGAFEALLAEAVGPTGVVYAVDISPAFLVHLAERAEREGTPQVRPVLGDERDPHLTPGSVQRIFVCDTYHHFTYPLTTGRHLYDALTPGGELLLVDFERIPGVTREWLMNHVRADKQTFSAELQEVGFELIEQVPIASFRENYVLRFRR